MSTYSCCTLECLVACCTLECLVAFGACCTRTTCWLGNGLAFAAAGHHTLQGLPLTAGSCGMAATLSMYLDIVQENALPMHLDIAIHVHIYMQIYTSTHTPAQHTHTTPSSHFNLLYIWHTAPLKYVYTRLPIITHFIQPLVGLLALVLTLPFLALSIVFQLWLIPNMHPRRNP